MNKRLLHAAQTVLTEPVEAEGTEIELHDTVNAPLSGLHIYGKSTQDTTTGVQLFDVDSCKDNIKFFMGTVENNGYVVAEFDNSKSENYKEVLLFSPLLDVEPNAEYKVILEVAEWTNISSFCITNGYIPTQTQFKEFVEVSEYNYNTSTDKIFSYTITTSDEVESQVFGLRTIAKVKVKSIGLIKYRISVIPNYVKDYVWEPYSGGIPSPNPYYPQEIVTVGGSGNFTANIAGNQGQDIQSLIISTPYGIPGIPVLYGGNYTDESGQQWVCDEVDFERRVYVQRINKVVLTEDGWYQDGQTDEYGYSYFLNTNAKSKTTHYRFWFCTHAQYKSKSDAHSWEEGKFTTAGNGSFEIETNKTLDEWKDYVKKLNDDGNPIIVFFVIEPIETPLSTAELATYKALHSNYPTTIITNSEDAHMKVNCLKIRGGGYKLLSLLFLKRRWCYA